jgi:hypothetical protein
MITNKNAETLETVTHTHTQYFTKKIENKYVKNYILSNKSAVILTSKENETNKTNIKRRFKKVCLKHTFFSCLFYIIGNS